jgi:histidinol dehydrogenase
LAPQARCFGALFVGAGAAEVFGDYGIGPNHILPTGGTARFSAGLSVFTFLAIRTTLRSIAPVDPEIVASTALLARAEGLDAHRRSALARSAETLALCS